MNNGDDRLVLYNRYGRRLRGDMLDRLRDPRADWDYELEVQDAPRLAPTLQR